MDTMDNGHEQVMQEILCQQLGSNRVKSMPLRMPDHTVLLKPLQTRSGQAVFV